MQKLKELRKESGKTQVELAKMLNISRQVYANYENSINEPSLETLLKLASIFDVSVDYLLGRTNDFDLSPEEYGAGIRTTTKKSISAIEDEMLMLFRDVGNKFGADGQRAVLTVVENMLNLK